MKKCMSVKRFGIRSSLRRPSRSGQTTVEWVVIVGAVVAVLVAVIPAFRGALTEAFGAITDGIKSLTK